MQREESSEVNVHPAVDSELLRPHEKSEDHEWNVFHNAESQLIIGSWCCNTGGSRNVPARFPLLPHTSSRISVCNHPENPRKIPLETQTVQSSGGRWDFFFPPCKLGKQLLVNQEIGLINGQKKQKIWRLTCGSAPVVSRRFQVND